MYNCNIQQTVMIIWDCVFNTQGTHLSYNSKLNYKIVAKIVPKAKNLLHFLISGAQNSA